MDAVLKVVSAEGTSSTLERMRRELRFYLELARDIPLRVPRLLGWIDGDSGLALLLSAYTPVRTPRRTDFAGIARDIALLHGAFWERTETLSGYSWLRSASDATDMESVERAQQWWQALAGQEATRHLVTARVLSWLERLLGDISQLDGALEGLPLTLCHGDCHTGNVLRDGEGHWVWADWQEVGLSRGPEDLSFLLQRSNGLPATVEYEVISAYCDQLAAAGISVEGQVVRWVLDAFELRTGLLQWPVFILSMPAPEKRLRRMLKRMRDTERRYGLLR